MLVQGLNTPLQAWGLATHITVSFLRLVHFSREEDELGAVLFQPLNIRLQRLQRPVLPAVVHSYPDTRR